ncbi:MAG: DnaJ domain-containing protein [Desulfobacteraceae bacterium]|jgi:DnaJ like chaperone protein
MKWIWIILALIYLLSPFDFIPGFHPAGWLDDIVVGVLLFRYLSKIARSGQPPYGKDQKTQQQESPQGNTSNGKQIRTPHEILGVAPNADQKEIQKAYRKLANQYHPDKVAHLGEEFQILAEQRFKEIQEAYDKLT